MLTELRITNLGVIAEATLEPGPGMTVITGETGAGKTMIVTGLGALLGERAEAGVVRHGTSRAVIEGRFLLPEGGQAEGLSPLLEEVGAELDGAELIAARQLQAGGRTRASLGGVQVPIGRLAAVVGELATIHGQSEQLRLGTPERQRQVLDRSGGPELLSALADYRAAWQRRAALRSELEELVGHARERARESDLLSFGIAEIEQVNPRPGEEADLLREANRLQAVDELRVMAQRVDAALSGSAEGDPDQPGAVALLGTARKALERLAELDETVAPTSTELRELAYQADDLAGRVASYLADLEADPARLEWLMGRRAELAGLTRKYGETIDEVLTWCEQAGRRLLDLNSDQDRIDELRAQVAEAETELQARAGVLSALRREASTRLAEQTAAELVALAMPHARIAFQLTALPEPGPWGAEQVVLLFAANAGGQLAPLAKVASGGELSRTRLALEVVLAGQEAGHTFVFDEVDAGVGGAVGLEIGRRLARLARSSQVIVVTHLAQVAAFADSHWVVGKTELGQVTVSQLHQVSGPARVSELARMMGGLADSPAGLQHARELLADAGRLEPVD